MMKALIFLLLSLLASCITRKDQVMCTEEFRSVTITVHGDTLDAHYTVRVSTGDTVFSAGITFPWSGVYVVLDDSYRQPIENRTEDFRFTGYVGDTLVVDEIFRISADRCHISYVSGKTDIYLP